jgi:hypothetical protein
MVVVGRMGKFKCFCCSSKQVPTGVALRWSEVFNAADCMQNNFIRNSEISKIYRQSIPFECTYSLLKSPVVHPWTRPPGSMCRSIGSKEILLHPTTYTSSQQMWTTY